MNKQPLILIIEDDRDVAKAAATRLTHAGFRVRTQTNAYAGVEAAVLARPSAILLDLDLRNADGRTVLSWLSIDTRTRDIPVVIFSVRKDASKKYLAFGATVQLSKPYSGSELIRKLREAMSLSMRKTRVDERRQSLQPRYRSSPKQQRSQLI